MKKEENLAGQRYQSVYCCSYILRIWREDISPNTGWRITLEDPLTAERFGFASLDQLHKFLLNHIEKK